MWHSIVLIKNKVVGIMAAILIAFGVAFGLYKAGKKQAKNEADINDLKRENDLLKENLKIKANEIKDIDAADKFIDNELHKG